MGRDYNESKCLKSSRRDRGKIGDVIERKCHRHRAFCEVIRPSLSHRFIGLHLISLEGGTIDIPAVFRMVAVPTCSVVCRIVYLYFVSNLLKEKKQEKRNNSGKVFGKRTKENPTRAVTSFEGLSRHMKNLVLHGTGMRT